MAVISTGVQAKGTLLCLHIFFFLWDLVFPDSALFAITFKSIHETQEMPRAVSVWWGQRVESGGDWNAWRLPQRHMHATCKSDLFGSLMPHAGRRDRPGLHMWWLSMQTMEQGGKWAPGMANSFFLQNESTERWNWGREEWWVGSQEVSGSENLFPLCANPICGFPISSRLTQSESRSFQMFI